MRAEHPRLIYAAISGYGHTGPKANRGGYDIIAQGEAGLMALTGPVDGGPSRFPTPMADISGGLYATLGVLGGALRARSQRRFGPGSLSTSRWSTRRPPGSRTSAPTYFATGERPRRLGNAHPNVTPYQPMRARDKTMIVGVGNERLWSDSARCSASRAR